MHSRYFVMFLLLAHLAFQVAHAQEVTVIQPEHRDCVGYNDSFDARVLDAKLRPVPNAGVTVTFDRGTTFGTQYFTTPVRFTDSNGLVPFTLLNQGTNSRDIDCTIVIDASIAGQSNTTTVYANEHGTPVDVLITTVYPVSFYVKNELGSPLPNATVAIENTTRTTDRDGRASFVLSTGEHGYFVGYLDGSQAGEVNVSDDTTVEAALRAYSVSLGVTDDFGNPLPATLMIFNKTFQLDNGTFGPVQTFGSDVPYRTAYNGTVQEGVITASENPHATVVYDIHAPLFGDIRTARNAGHYQLVIPVSDPGNQSSGVNLQSIRVTYRVEPAEPTTPWNTAVAFTSGKGIMTAEFPDLPPSSVVSFRVDMSDMAGNKASIEGKFSTLAGQPAPANNTQNQTNTQPSTSQEQGIPLLYIFIGVIVALLIVYVVFHIKSQGGGGGG